MNSEVITSTFTGTLMSSWLVRLPMRVVVACQDLSSVSETVNGEREMTSSAVGALAGVAAGTEAWEKTTAAAASRQLGGFMGSRGWVCERPVMLAT